MQIPTRRRDILQIINKKCTRIYFNIKLHKTDFSQQSGKPEIPFIALSYKILLKSQQSIIWSIHHVLISTINSRLYSRKSGTNTESTNLLRHSRGNRFG